VLAVITSIMGGYDTVPPIPRGFDEAVLVSDVPIASDWTNFVMPTGLPSRLAAKIPKFRPDLFTQSTSSVWMDASLNNDSGWLYEASRKALDASDFCLFRHPDRDSVADEVLVSKSMPKYLKFPLEEQLSSYLQQGFLDNVGLFACGVLARRHTAEIQHFGNAWLAENLRWSIQDQVSFPFLVWKHRLSCTVYPANLWHGPLTWKGHIGQDLVEKQETTMSTRGLVPSLFSRLFAKRTN
jgi:hypothetical protein